jgi:hypothetical protein
VCHCLCDAKCAPVYVLRRSSFSVLRELDDDDDDTAQPLSGSSKPRRRSRGSSKSGSQRVDELPTRSPPRKADQKYVPHASSARLRPHPLPKKLRFCQSSVSGPLTLPRAVCACASQGDGVLAVLWRQGVAVLGVGALVVGALLLGPHGLGPAPYRQTQAPHR